MDIAREAKIGRPKNSWRMDTMKTLKEGKLISSDLENKAKLEMAGKLLSVAYVWQERLRH